MGPTGVAINRRKRLACLVLAVFYVHGVPATLPHRAAFDDYMHKELLEEGLEDALRTVYTALQLAYRNADREEAEPPEPNAVADTLHRLLRRELGTSAHLTPPAPCVSCVPCCSHACSGSCTCMRRACAAVFAHVHACTVLESCARVCSKQQ